MMNNVLIIIPTYNESQSIIKILELVIKINPDYNILIIDDNSPDNTSSIVTNYINK